GPRLAAQRGDAHLDVVRRRVAFARVKLHVLEVSQRAPLDRLHRDAQLEAGVGALTEGGCGRDPGHRGWPAEPEARPRGRQAARLPRPTALAGPTGLA